MTDQEELQTSDDANLGSLLAETSRTFALSIPLLPDGLRREVTVAYLLFRIADTIEDEVDWGTEEKIAGLELFSRWIAVPDREQADGVLALLSSGAVEHDGYSLLMRSAGDVLRAYASLRPSARESIARHLARSAVGMAEQLRRNDAAAGVDGTRGYCYSVAGIVGELCTELFIGHDPHLRAVSDELMPLAPGFGEGLQLVNILRDERTDADAGRRYMPIGDRERLLELARRGLFKAREYIRVLEEHGADPGTVAFNALNAVLACDTLRLLHDRGVGVKLDRELVESHLREIRDRANSGRAIVPFVRDREDRMTSVAG
jgi:farnesyl-diphosphate farnesyltransferase